VGLICDGDHDILFFTPRYPDTSAVLIAVSSSGKVREYVARKFEDVVRW